MVAPVEGPVLILGAAGRLGRALARVYPRAVLTGHDLEITDGAAVREFVAVLRPSLVYNCAALTDVDACEEDPARAMAVNGEGAGHVARACARVGAVLVHLSTDYVFGGAKDGYLESDGPDPVNAYGRSKALGEARVREAGGDWRIVRTSRLFGPGENDFASQMRTRSLVKPVVPVIDDEWSRFTYLPELAARGLPPGERGRGLVVRLRARADPERGAGDGGPVPAAGAAPPVRVPAQHETPADAPLAGGALGLCSPGGGRGIGYTSPSTAPVWPDGGPSRAVPGNPVRARWFETAARRAGRQGIVLFGAVPRRPQRWLRPWRGAGGASRGEPGA